MTTPRTTTRRVRAATAGLAVVLGASACGSPDVTAARVADSLTATFTDLYGQQATILGTPGDTAAATRASTSCDKGGPNVADTGPGSSWVCMVDFTDTTGAAQTGKFELQVRADSCWTASGPSKIIGLATITDTTGRDVTNPVFEFDGCFDPHA